MCPECCHSSLRIILPDPREPYQKVKGFRHRESPATRLPGMCRGVFHESPTTFPVLACREQSLLNMLSSPLCAASFCKVCKSGPEGRPRSVAKREEREMCGISKLSILCWAAETLTILVSFLVFAQNGDPGLKSVLTGRCAERCDVMNGNVRECAPTKGITVGV